MLKKIVIAMMTIPLFASVVFAGANSDVVAKDVCGCLKKPYDQIRAAAKTIREAQVSGDMSKIMSAQGDMMGVIESAGECFDLLAKKHPAIDKSDPLKMEVMAKAEKICPNPANEFLMKQ